MKDTHVPVNQILPMKKAFTIIGWGFFASVFAWQASSTLISWLLKEFLPAFTAKYSVPINLAMMFVPLYLIGMPLFLLITRKLFQFKIPFAKCKKIHIKDFVLLLVCGLGCSYVLNFITTMLNALIALLFTKDLNSLISNDVTSVYNNNYLLGLLSVGILAPILEEFIFRGILINKLRPYGEGICIIASGFIFGLFHANGTQILFAAALGMVFAFTAIRTGTIIYSILMHILINSYSVTLSQVILNPDATMEMKLIFSIIVIVITITVLACGITFTALRAKRCNIKPTVNYLADGTAVGFKGTAKAFFSSAGVVCYIVAIGILVVLNYVVLLSR